LQASIADNKSHFIPLLSCIELSRIKGFRLFILHDDCPPTDDLMHQCKDEREQAYQSLDSREVTQFQYLS
jgi:hypothetical protein